MGNDRIKMATSVIDYVFRELAISYLGRTDLSHVPDEDLRSDTLGNKIGQGPVAMIPPAPPAVAATVPDPASTARAAAPLSGGSGALAELKICRPRTWHGSGGTRAIRAAIAASSPWSATEPASSALRAGRPPAAPDMASS